MIRSMTDLTSSTRQPATAPRLLYLATATLWGLLLGAAAFIAVAGALLGAAWLFVHGDDPWPQDAGRIPLAIAGLIALAVLLGALAAAWKLAERHGAGEPATRAKGRRGAWLLLLLAVVLGLAGAALAGLANHRTTSERDRAHRQAVVFSALEGMRQRFAEVTTTLDRAENRLHLRLHTKGMVGGPYRLNLAARRSALAETLWQDSRLLALSPNQNLKHEAVDLDPLIRSYRDRLFSDPRATGEVSEELVLELTLEPHLTPEERLELPVPARAGLVFGQTTLIDRRDLPLKLDLRFADGSYRWLP